MKDKSLIPKGQYCYTWLEFPSKENGFKGKTKPCPFYGNKDINGVKVPWCSYLEEGGTDNGWEDEEWQKVKARYKTEEDMDNALPLSLLWDACKECGENFEDDEYES